MKQFYEKHSGPVLFTALGLLLMFVAYVGLFGRQTVTESKFENLAPAKQEAMQKRAAELGEKEDYLEGSTVFSVK